MPTQPAPLVSVILPTLNRAAALRRSMASVLRQSFSDLELIVVDDGSTEDVQAAAAQFGDARVRYVRRERNGGVAAARNTGVAASRGRYVAFQDSDDEWLLDKLTSQFADLQPLDDTAMSVCGLIRYLPSRGDGVVKVLTYPRGNAHWRHGLDWHRVLASGVAYTQSWLVPRWAVVKAGGFDERLSIWDDWDLLIRLARLLPIRTRPDPLVISERGDDSLSADPWRFVRDIECVLAKYLDADGMQRRDQAALRYVYAAQLCPVGRVREARGELLRSVLSHPPTLRAWRLLAITMLGPKYVQRRLGASGEHRVRDLSSRRAKDKRVTPNED